MMRCPHDAEVGAGLTRSVDVDVRESAHLGGQRGQGLHETRSVEVDGGEVDRDGDDIVAGRDAGPTEHGKVADVALGEDTRQFRRTDLRRRPRVEQPHGNVEGDQSRRGLGDRCGRSREHELA
jgi:hypothetical protein